MPKLTDKQTEKYSRQIIIEKIGMRGQEKILKSSVCICFVKPKAKFLLPKYSLLLNDAL